MTLKVKFWHFLTLFDISPLTKFSKFNNFLWVYWFLGKNLSNFVPPLWKLHNPYCHKVHTSLCLVGPNYWNKLPLFFSFNLFLGQKSLKERHQNFPFEIFWPLDWREHLIKCSNRPLLSTRDKLFSSDSSERQMKCSSHDFTNFFHIFFQF